jgi:predicted O-methyltransferase YrrM
VEVGAWMGQSAIHLAQRLQDLGKRNVKVVCIDTWEGEKGQPDHQPIMEAHGGSIKAVFDANVAAAQVGDVIEAVVSDSAKGAALFADKSISGVFIDAAHDYESVKRDLAAWWPKVRDGGIFSGHDYDWHEVKRAVDEHAAANGWEIGTVGNVWVKNERLFSVRATGANPVLF